MPRNPQSADLEAFVMTKAAQERRTLDHLAGRLEVSVPRLLDDLRRGSISEEQLRTIMFAIGVPPDLESDFMDTALTRRAARKVMARLEKLEADSRSLRSAINALVGRAQGAR